MSAGDAVGGPVTRAEWAEDNLRKAILEGVLEPGERLNINDLTERWSVSPTPLREALQRLAQQGLVTIAPQRGTFVTMLTEQDLREVYEIREMLEPLAAYQSVRHMSAPDVERLQVAREQLVAAYSRDPRDRRESEQAHREFHLAVLAASPSSWLLRLTTLLLDHSARYRVVSTDLRGGASHVVQEHLAIFDAALDGDADAVRDAVQQHLASTFAAALAYLGEQPPPDRGT